MVSCTPILIQLAFLLLAQNTQGKKNVLFVIVDDLRPALGCFNDPNAETPNIDAFAKKSTIFTRAYAQQALCAPSRNSLLTSRHPDSLFNYDLESYWRVTAGNFTTIPQHFKNQGYTTALYGKVFHPGTSSNKNDDGPYSWNVPPYHPSTIKYSFSKVCPDEKGEVGMNILCPVEPHLQPEGTLPDIQTTEAAREFLRNHNNSNPFFLAIGFHKPHISLKFPRKYLDSHPLSKISYPVPSMISPTLPPVAWNPWTDVRRRDDVTALNLTFPYEPIPTDFTQKIRQHYYAAVTYIDDLFGQIMTTMKQKKLLDNTVIAFFGDHGWSMGEHQEWAKYSNYENALRVPLIIYDPERHHQSSGLHNDITPRIRDDLIELVDVFPTLTDLASLPTPPACSPAPMSQILCTEGRSLKQLMYTDRRPSEWRLGAFSQNPRPGPLPQRDSDKPLAKDIRVMGYTVRTERHRYTEWVAFRDLTPDWSQVHGVELYDHHIDSAEENNLAGRELLKDLQKKLRNLLIEGWRYSAPNTSK